MMHQTTRLALALLLGTAWAVVSASARAQEAPPEEKPQEPPPAETEQQEPPQTDDSKDQPPTEGADDASVRTPAKVSAEDVLKAFQKDRPTRVPIAPSARSDEPPLGVGPPGTGTSRRLPDGFFLVDRVGRVVKAEDWYVFTFESYSESHPEPPMKLLPNQLLERMVLESESATDSTTFIVSGEVTEFMGENYLLLRKLLRRRSLGNLEK